MQRVVLAGNVRELYDRADAALKAQAKEDLVDQIIAGKHQLDVAAILDSAFDASLADVREIGAMLGKLLNTHGDDRILAVGDLDARLRRMVEEYVSARPDMIRERAEEISADVVAESQ